MHTGRPRIWGSAWRSSTIGRAPTTPFWTKVPDVVRAAAPPSAATPLRRRPHRLNETIVAWARRIRLILAEIGNRTIDLSQKPRVKLVVAEAYFASAPPLRFSKVCGRRGSESGDGSGSVSGFGERLGLGRRRWRLGRLGHWRAASPLARGRREGTAGLCFTTFFRRPGRCGAPLARRPPERGAPSAPRPAASFEIGWRRGLVRHGRLELRHFSIMVKCLKTSFSIFHVPMKSFSKTKAWGLDKFSASIISAREECDLQLEFMICNSISAPTTAQNEYDSLYKNFGGWPTPVSAPGEPFAASRRRS
jgi:hypothetical protein